MAVIAHKEREPFFSRVIKKKNILHFKDICDKYNFTVTSYVNHSQTKVRFFIMASGDFTDIDLDSIWSARKNKSGYEMGTPIVIKATGEKGYIAHICWNTDRFYYTVNVENKKYGHLEGSMIERRPLLSKGD